MSAHFTNWLGRLSDAALLERCEAGIPATVYKPRTCAAPEPRYVIVECGRDCEGLLQQHWLSGEPVEICGVLFEMAVVARRRSWWRPMLVRGIVKR